MTTVIGRSVGLALLSATVLHAQATSPVVRPGEYSHVWQHFNERQFAQSLTPTDICAGGVGR
jgi:hypothetical protein